MANYWDLSPAERKVEGVPRVFAQDVYKGIHEWYGNFPMIQPLHVRDTLDPDDHNYTPQTSQLHEDHDGESELEIGDPTDCPPPHDFQVNGESTPPRSPNMTSSTSSRRAATTEPVGTSSSRPYNGFPPRYHTTLHQYF